MFLLLLFLAQAYEVLKIPSTGPPPVKRIALSTVYDAYTNQLFVFGGYNNILSEFQSTVHTFSLTSYTWGEILPQSLINPNGFSESCSYIRPDRTILFFFGENEFGISSDIYSFSLETYSWKIEVLTGDPILGRTGASCASFEYENEDYMVVFGGLNVNGKNNDLFMINLQSLRAELLPKVGEAPVGMFDISIVYYESAFYLFGYLAFGSNFEDWQNLYKYDLNLKHWEILEVGDVKPEYRMYHDATIYDNEMYIFYGCVYETFEVRNTIWKFNFASQGWSLVSDIAEDATCDTYGQKIGSKYYFLFGIYQNNIANTVLCIDLSETNPKSITLSQNWDSPSSRKNHCSVVIRDRIYIFGGVTSAGIHLNELWYFDIANYIWVYVVTSGAIPAAREFAACTVVTDTSILVFGGIDSKMIYNDFIIYNEQASTWKVMESISGNTPSPRYASCILYYNYYAFIVGGRDYMAAYDEIWVYDYLNRQYTLVESDVHPYNDIIHYKCWIDEVDGLAIYTIGGQYLSQYPSNYAVKIDISTTSSGFRWSPSLYYTFEYQLPAFTSIVHSGDYVYLFFGSMLNYLITSKIYSFNFRSKEEKVWILDSEMLLASHSAVHYADSVYIFGGALATDDVTLLNKATNKFFKLEKSLDLLNFLQCSIGTIGTDCKPCGPGYYADDNECVLCPAGTYSISFSSSSVFGCTPCAFGSFNPTPGSTYCVNCPSYSYCPIGSSDLTKKIEILEYQSIQPKDYTAQTGEFSNLIGNLWYVIIAVTGIIAVISVVSSRLWKKIQHADIFVNLHSQDLNIPVIYRQTEIGGIFSIFFLLAAGITISGSFATFYIDNITESKSLVPVLLLDSTIKAEVLEITTSFYSYQQKCAENSECLEANTFIESGFTFDSKSAYCEKIESLCKVVVTYSGFSMVSASTVSIQMKEVLASATAITVNVSSSSSIPNEKSSVFIPVYTDSNLNLFVGIVPTVINYEFTPSVFKTDSSNWNSLDTGYHLTVDQDISKGSQNPVETAYSDFFLLVTLKFSISSTGLVIHRFLNNTFLMFFGALLGAVFGLMGSIASIMGVVEGFTEKIQGKLKNNEKRNSLRKSRNHLISGFRPGETEIESESFNKTEVQFTKVFPFETNAKINTFF